MNREQEAIEVAMRRAFADGDEDKRRGQAAAWDQGWAACSAWWHSCAADASEPERAINPYDENTCKCVWDCKHEWCGCGAHR